MNTKINKEKGDITLIVVLILFLTGALGGVWVDNKIHDIKAKKEQQDTAKLATELQQEKAATQKLIDLQSQQAQNQLKIEAAKKQRLDQVATLQNGSVMALTKEKQPSINVVTAIVLGKSAINGLAPDGVASSDALKEIQATVDNLTNTANAAQQQLGQAQLLVMQNSVTAARADEAKANSDKASLATEAQAAKDALKGVQGDLNKTADKLNKLNLSHSDLQKDYNDIRGKFSLLGASYKYAKTGLIVIIAALLLFGLILPILGKAFPEAVIFTWLAKKGGAVLMWGLHVLHKAELLAAAEAKTAVEAVATEAKTLYKAEQAAHSKTQTMLVAVATGTPAPIPAPAPIPPAPIPPAAT